MIAGQDLYQGEVQEKVRQLQETIIAESKMKMNLIIKMEQMNEVINHHNSKRIIFTQQYYQSIRNS